MKLSTTELKQVTLDLDDNGTVHKLVVEQFRVKDSIRAGRIQRTFMSDEDLDNDGKVALITVSRCMCAVKTEDGEYFWAGDNVQQVADSQSGNFWVQLSAVVSEVNPLPLGDGDLESRKKRSSRTRN